MIAKSHQAGGRKSNKAKSGAGSTQSRSKGTPRKAAKPSRQASTKRRSTKQTRKAAGHGGSARSGKRGARPAERNRRGDAPKSSKHPKQRQRKPSIDDAIGLPEDADGYGVSTYIAIVESEGKQRRRRVGGISKVYKRPAQRPRHKFVDQMSSEDLAKLLSAFAHPHRVAIIKAIFAGAGHYADLREKVPLKAGPMYHHLRELRLAGVLADGPRDVYELTQIGRDALLIVCSLGSLRQK